MRNRRARGLTGMLTLVTGATGNVGGAVVRALLGRGAPVRALVRSSAGAAALPDGAEPFVGDLDKPASLDAALDGAGALFLLPGFSDMPSVVARARAAGVRRVVLLSGTSAEDGIPDNAITAYMRSSEAAVRGGGVPWTILRPSGFMTNTLQWAGQLRSGDVVRAPFPGVPVAMIDPDDIGAVAATVILDGDAHAGRVLRLSGPEPLTPADRVATLAAVLDRPLRLDGQSDEEARAEMLAAMPQKYVDAFFLFYAEGALDESPVVPTVEQVTGRAPRTFRAWAEANAGAFQ